MESIPGQRFSQNSAGSLIILEALESATGLSVDEMVSEWLFKPLQINDWTVRKDDVGLSDLSLGLAIKPLDLLKIGDLMLNNGSWLGNRIVSASWVSIEFPAFRTWGIYGGGFQMIAHGQSIFPRIKPSMHSAMKITTCL